MACAMAHKWRLALPSTTARAQALPTRALWDTFVAKGASSLRYVCLTVWCSRHSLRCVQRCALPSITCPHKLQDEPKTTVLQGLILASLIVLLFVYGALWAKLHAPREILKLASNNTLHTEQEQTLKSASTLHDVLEAAARRNSDVDGDFQRRSRRHSTHFVQHASVHFQNRNPTFNHPLRAPSARRPLVSSIRLKHAPPPPKHVANFDFKKIDNPLAFEFHNLSFSLTAGNNVLSVSYDELIVCVLIWVYGCMSVCVYACVVFLLDKAVSR
jgi:hypothetical protein